MVTHDQCTHDWQLIYGEVSSFYCPDCRSCQIAATHPLFRHTIERWVNDYINNRMCLDEFTSLISGHSQPNTDDDHISFLLNELFSLYIDMTEGDFAEQGYKKMIAVLINYDGE